MSFKQEQIYNVSEFFLRPQISSFLWVSYGVLLLVIIISMHNSVSADTERQLIQEIHLDTYSHWKSLQEVIFLPCWSF